jgi:hypothetical protein
MVRRLFLLSILTATLLSEPTNRAENSFILPGHTASFLSPLYVDHKQRYLPQKIEKSLLNDVSDKVLHDLYIDYLLAG